MALKTEWQICAQTIEMEKMQYKRYFKWFQKPKSCRETFWSDFAFLSISQNLWILCGTLVSANLYI